MPLLLCRLVVVFRVLVFPLVLTSTHVGAPWYKSPQSNGIILDGDPGSKFLEPNLDSSEVIESLSWTLLWTLACILVLQIMSFPLELFFSFGGVGEGE
jgi:hypothetical protein